MLKEFFDSLKTRIDYRAKLGALASIEINAQKQWQAQGGLNRNLQNGDYGGDVLLLQQLLIDDEEIYPEKEITAYFGKLTKKAVVKFQKKYNLPQTGYVGKLTREKINELYFNELCPKGDGKYGEMILAKIDRDNGLPSGYSPPDLINISTKVRTSSITCLRTSAAQYLEKMFEAAKSDGVKLLVTSGYRKPEIQKWLNDYWRNINGFIALIEVAAPGYSEHQLGTTVDLAGESNSYLSTDPNFGNTKEGKWLYENAYKYGFIMSYPKGKEAKTSYMYEPWHYRFVGETIAKEIREKNLTFNEWLKS